ncbi:hypothetical protein ACTXT7_016770 [Hymenolepis weldensis]
MLEESWLKSNKGHTKLDYEKSDREATSESKSSFMKLAQLSQLSCKLFSHRTEILTYAEDFLILILVPRALREHHGTYRCRVTNAAGQAQHIGHLLVRSNPSLTIQPQQSTYFLARQPLFISCLVSGYPLALTNLSSLQSVSLEELNSATNSVISGIKFLDQADKMIAQQQMNPEMRKNGILMETEDISPVRLLVLTEERVQEKFVKPRLSDLRAGIYEGFNRQLIKAKENFQDILYILELR